MLNEPRRKGFLLVISSPSGGGKSTIYKAILERGEPFAFSVSATTRPPRADEIDGVHYNFIDDAEFDRMISDGEFAEWANVHGHRYGSPKKYVEEALAKNKIMIFEIDVQGAMQLKKSYPDDAVLVFIAPPSRKETEKRLRERKTDSPEDIALRLNNAVKEIEFYRDYNYLVFNDRLEDAIEDVLSITNAERLRTKRFEGELWIE